MIDPAYSAAIDSVLDDVIAEIHASNVKHGNQDHLPDGTDAAEAIIADYARDACDWAFKRGRGTWRHILDEEIAEAFAETDPARLRVELVQVASVVAKWIIAIDKRSTPSAQAAAIVVEAAA